MGSGAAQGISTRGVGDGRRVSDGGEPGSDHPLPADSPLYDQPNVLLTPHIAGSFGNEMQRLGAAALDELARYCVGLPFAHQVRSEEADRTA